ncbi:MAG TPA: sigma-70 family RNA polymerase sigma factor [Actinomycetota bacterium]|jgi:RNA polymerase sigma-70 factor (ECF subfamily)
MAPNSVFLKRLDGDDLDAPRPDSLGEDFDALYRRYYPRLVAMCRRRAGDETLAEDVSQETLIRALTHRDAFQQGRPVWPWLKTIATNLIVDHYRKQVRESALLVDREHVAEEGPSLEETDLLRRAIQQLPRRQRAAVALRYLNDWDAHDAASFMGVTRPAYEQLLFRARRRLKTEYRRLSQEVSAGVSAGSAALRQWSRRAGIKARELGTGHPALLDLTAVTGAQVAGGALALIIALGASPAPSRAPSTTPISSLRAAAAAPVGEGEIDRHDSDGTRAHKNAFDAPAAASGTADAAPAPAGDRADDRGFVDRMLDPNDDVQQPEDAHITSIVPAGSPGGVTYAAGRTDCPSGTCPAVLFQSRDGGASWARLAAEGFDAETLLVPPSAGADTTIFAMGRLGLQVSRDNGETFVTTSAAGASYTVGSAAISPAFTSGDPTILIGAQTLMRYRDDLGIVEPARWATGTGPLQPAFSPQYPADDRVFVGGLVFNPEVGRPTSAVYTCSDGVCAHTFAGELSLDVQIRTAPDLSRSNRLYAFTPRGIFTSSDGGATFAELVTPWNGDGLADVAVGPGGQRLFAAVRFEEGGLYASDDDGATWTEVANELFAHGASSIASAGERIVVALDGNGVACSSDGGTTWAARCGPTG